jgi:hypothetical protein
VYSVNKMGSRESRSPWGQITDTFKEKLDTVVRGRRHSREHSDRYPTTHPINAIPKYGIFKGIVS